MDCQRIQDVLSDYVDGLLPARSVAMVDSHIAGCPSCATDLQQLRRTVAMLRAVPPLTPPAYFAHAVQARVLEASQPRQFTLPLWLYPSRQGFAVRLLATAIMMLALIPPVRRPVVNAGWGLLGFHNTPAVDSKGTPAPHPTQPGARTEPAPVVPAAVVTSTAPSTAQPPSEGTGYPAIPPVAAQPQPLVRPAVADTGVQYKVDGTLAPGVPQVVTVAVTSRKDMLLNSAIDVSLTPGARFITDSGSRPDAARTVWTGNLVEGLPASVPVTLVAARPGLYDVRVTVRSDGREVGASDLLLPIGMAPSTEGVNVNAGDPISLYSVVESLAAQSARPIAVEEGLSGTRTVSLKSHNFRSALDASAAQFGCAVDEQNGVDHILLHPAS